MMRHPSHARLLAIDATSRGFGFVVADRSGGLIDWGTTHARSPDRRGVLAGRLRVILKRYGPAVVLIEDGSAPRCRRSTQVRCFLAAAVVVASEEGARVRPWRARDVRKAFARSGAKTKHDVASAIAARFPELERHLPPKRKLWTSEDERMSIFDAAAVAIGYLERERRPVT